MKSIEATFRVVTPLFMAGSDQNQAEFRIPSLLGALRFWYRATAPKNMQKDIAALRRAETALFGSIGTGQAQFVVRMKSDRIVIGDPAKSEWVRNRYGISYLGFGPITYKGILRKYIKEESEFKLGFIFRPIIEKPDIDGLKRAIWALSLFGGLGSRSRHGFGSIMLTSLKDEEGKEIWRSQQTREDLHISIQEFITSIGSKDISGLSEYTAFTSSSRIILSKTSQNMVNLIDNIGLEMIRYRSYGRRNRNGAHTLPDGEKAEQNFADDHDLLLSFDPNSRRHPRRVAFGLPHNYYFGSTQLKVDVNGEMSDRRASPLFIHIHQVEKEHVAVLTYLPAKFLPDREFIKMVTNGQSFRTACNFDGQVITDFLKRIPDAVEVI